MFQAATPSYALRGKEPDAWDWGVGSHLGRILDFEHFQSKSGTHLLAHAEYTQREGLPGDRCHISWTAKLPWAFLKIFEQSRQELFSQHHNFLQP